MQPTINDDVRLQDYNPRKDSFANTTCLVQASDLFLPKAKFNVAFLEHLNSQACVFEQVYTWDHFTADSVMVSEGLRKPTDGRVLVSIDPVGINSNHIAMLKSYRQLENNWDENESLAPTEQVIEDAIRFAEFLQSIGENIYQVAPGPNGEIMIELRNKEKSIEFLFYSNRTKYVDFSTEHPTQGLLNDEILPQLLASLNEK